MNINLYDKVKFTGFGGEEGPVKTGDIGYVIEDYQDGNFEVEFSTPDGISFAQEVISERFLEKVG